ncbi:hypothetical protein TcWFU_000878 [Taenia crassiceps]|uniref:Secreted protein n=1 Tax=Taenia crassiceps TaxID=6207 RepID=A0ABR4QKY8_9CEST
MCADVRWSLIMGKSHWRHIIQRTWQLLFWHRQLITSHVTDSQNGDVKRDCGSSTTKDCTLKYGSEKNISVTRHFGTSRETLLPAFVITWRHFVRL